MRLTVLGQYAKGLGRTPTRHGQPPPREAALTLLERTKHYLWHGNLFRALETLDDLDDPLIFLADPDSGEDKQGGHNRGRPTRGESAETSGGPSVTKLARALAEFRGYLEANERFIPNYGERWRQGEPIATGFVESTVNAVVSKRFAKRQQMQWTPKGAHLLLQVRTRVLNGELDDLFRAWYAGFRPAPIETPAAAA